jgi:hypothetical protein
MRAGRWEQQSPPEIDRSCQRADKGVRAAKRPSGNSITDLRSIRSRPPASSVAELEFDSTCRFPDKRATLPSAQKRLAKGCPSFSCPESSCSRIVIRQ